MGGGGGGRIFNFYFQITSPRKRNTMHTCTQKKNFRLLYYHKRHEPQRGFQIILYPFLSLLLFLVFVRARNLKVSKGERYSCTYSHIYIYIRSEGKKNRERRMEAKLHRRTLCSDHSPYHNSRGSHFTCYTH